MASENKTTLQALRALKLKQEMTVNGYISLESKIDLKVKPSLGLTEIMSKKVPVMKNLTTKKLAVSEFLNKALEFGLNIWNLVTFTRTGS